MYDENRLYIFNNILDTIKFVEPNREDAAVIDFINKNLRFKDTVKKLSDAFKEIRNGNTETFEERVAEIMPSKNKDTASPHLKKYLKYKNKYLKLKGGAD